MILYEDITNKSTKLIQYLHRNEIPHRLEIDYKIHMYVYDIDCDKELLLVIKLIHPWVLLNYENTVN